MKLGPFELTFTRGSYSSLPLPHCWCCYPNPLLSGPVFLNHSLLFSPLISHIKSGWNSLSAWLKSKENQKERHNISSHLSQEHMGDSVIPVKAAKDILSPESADLALTTLGSQTPHVALYIPCLASPSSRLLVSWGHLVSCVPRSQGQTFLKTKPCHKKSWIEGLHEFLFERLSFSCYYLLRWSFCLPFSAVGRAQFLKMAIYKVHYAWKVFKAI